MLIMNANNECGKQKNREREREINSSKIPFETKSSTNCWYSKIFTKHSLILKVGILAHLFPIFCSFFSDKKLFHHPFHYCWEFLTLWWCVWNSSLSIFYHQGELKRKKQNYLGIIVAVSNLATTLLFTLTLFLKPRIIGNKSFWWWTYTSVWHYVAPVMSLTYFFVGTKLKKTVSQKKARKGKKFFGLVILQPTFFTIANLARKWIISSWGNKIFLGESEEGKKLRFKKFVILWLDHGDQFITNVKRGKEITKNILLAILYIGATFFSFYFVACLLVSIKMAFFPPAKRKQKKFLTKK
jgi:hypothetical protein